MEKLCSRCGHDIVFHNTRDGRCSAHLNCYCRRLGPSCIQPNPTDAQGGPKGFTSDREREEVG